MPMSYVKKVLLPGEILVYETGLHWLVYGRAILLLVAGSALAIGTLALTGGQIASSGPEAALAAAGLLGVVGFLAYVGAAIRRASTELAVTDQRVIYKSGIISRHTLEMNRSKVESVDVDQSILGRIFGYGTVVLRGTGGSSEPMAAISAPLAFRSHITADPVRRGANTG
jgi:uncharacterized membrane protein YdbT with pleckstrin-like domain